MSTYEAALREIKDEIDYGIKNVGAGIQTYLGLLESIQETARKALAVPAPPSAQEVDPCDFAAWCGRAFESRVGGWIPRGDEAIKRLHSVTELLAFFKQSKIK